MGTRYCWVKLESAVLVGRKMLVEVRSDQHHSCDAGCVDVGATLGSREKPACAANHQQTRTLPETRRVKRVRVVTNRERGEREDQANSVLRKREER